MPSPCTPAQGGCRRKDALPRRSTGPSFAQALGGACRGAMWPASGDPQGRAQRRPLVGSAEGQCPSAGVQGRSPWGATDLGRPAGRIDRGSVFRSDCVRVQLLQRIQADVARGRHDAGRNGLRQTVQRDPRIATDLGRRCRGTRRRNAMRRAIRGGPATDLGRQLQRRGATDCGRPRGEAVATDCGRPDVHIKTDPRFPTRFCDATAAPGGALQRSAATSAQIRCNVCRKRLPGLPESVGPSARNGCR